MNDDVAIHRELCRRFGTENLRGRRVLASWHDRGAEDWCVAIVAGADGVMLLESMESAEETFVIREPFAEHGLHRVFDRLLEAAAAAGFERRMELVERCSTLLRELSPIDPDAEDLPDAAVCDPETRRRREWVASALTDLGRDAAGHGFAPGGHC